MNETDVKWEHKSYGLRANIFAIRLFIHSSEGLRNVSWGADYDPNWAPSVHKVMNTAVRMPAPAGITHVSGETADVDSAKHQAFLAAKQLLGTVLKKKAPDVKRKRTKMARRS